MICNLHCCSDQPTTPSPSTSTCFDYGSTARWVGFIDVPNCPWPEVAISGTYAYVAAVDSGLVVLDISDPRRPPRS